jgi:hypothetical protein
MYDCRLGLVNLLRMIIQMELMIQTMNWDL